MKFDCLMLSRKALLAVALSSALVQCSEEQLLLDTASINSTTTFDLDADAPTEIDDCSGCTYVVPADARVIDGAALGLKPGSVIGLSAKVTYGQLLFKNIIGTLENPIIIRNCGGVAQVNGTDKGYSISTQSSEYFRITGGDSKNFYGIVLTGGNMGLNLGNLSNHFEVDHLEIHDTGFAGIMAKTDPGCNEATWRENFLMKGIALHNNYIHDTGGEGIYAGNSFFTGMNTPCGVKLPHEIHYIRIYSNILRNTGWEAIQLGCATKGASIHANVIENYGVANEKSQNNGIQIGAGTGGVCYNNLIRGGTGNGLIVMGLGDNVIYNNIIDQAGNYGIFCDERYSPGPGFKFINNTILNPKSDGIRIYADMVPMNVIVNNIISNPGSYNTYSYPRKPEDAFIYRLNSDVKTTESNNYFSIDATPSQTSVAAELDYHLACSPAVVDRGADISVFGIKTDFYYKPRLKGAFYDIGAVEQ